MRLKSGLGLIILFLLTLILLVVIFTASKYIIPNPQTVQENKQIKKDAQDAVDKYQQRNIQDQKIDINQ